MVLVCVQEVVVVSAIYLMHKENIQRLKIICKFLNSLENKYEKMVCAVCTVKKLRAAGGIYNIKQ